MRFCTRRLHRGLTVEAHSCTYSNQNVRLMCPAENGAPIPRGTEPGLTEPIQKPTTTCEAISEGSRLLETSVSYHSAAKNRYLN